MENTVNLDFAEHVHKYLGEFIRAADQKAAFLLAAATALLAWLATQKTAISTQSLASPCKGFLLAVVMLFVGLSALLAVGAVWPRQHRVTGGLIAWTGILAIGGSKKYGETVAKLGSEDCLSEVSAHCFELSRILKVKYQLLWFAILAFILGGGLKRSFDCGHSPTHQSCGPLTGPDFPGRGVCPPIDESAFPRRRHWRVWATHIRPCG